jgi:predicted nuclease of restriction endonuclease-like (RecB) superfamily
MSVNLNESYGSLLTGIKDRVKSAQYEALRSVNRELVMMYWDIGHMIADLQGEDSWGKSVVTRLSDDLRQEFPGMMGFSVQNLWYMRQFYLTYSADPKLQPLVGEISWTKHLAIMGKCHDSLQREFYIRMTRRHGWSKNILVHQIENQTYEKTLLNQNNFEETLPASISNEARLALKDEYTFDFLELGAEHSERELERALISRIEEFLRAMGGLFAFMGSQFRLEVDGREFFIDLLLYHRRLKCLVALELKIGEFEPEYVGKMQFYLAALDTQMREEGENPSIGIILCKEKSRTIVEYALRDASRPIGIATYRIVSELPWELEGQIPGPEEISRLLEGI